MMRSSLNRWLAASSLLVLAGLCLPPYSAFASPQPLILERPVFDRISGPAEGPSLLQIDVAYPVGWALLSLPVDPGSDLSPAEAFPDAIAVFRYEDGAFIEPEVIVPGVAYFVRHRQAGTLTFAGDPLDASAITLEPGWNVIGSLSFPVLVENLGQAPVDNIVGAFGFDEGTFGVATIIEPGFGYWVFAETSGSVALEPEEATPPSIANVQTEILDASECDPGQLQYAVFFDFTDANGDVRAGSVVNVDFVFQPSGQSGSLTIEDPLLTGNGFEGRGGFGLCIGFAPGAFVELRLTLVDAGGLASNMLETTIQPVDGMPAVLSNARVEFDPSSSDCDLASARYRFTVDYEDEDGDVGQGTTVEVTATWRPIDETAAITVQPQIAGDGGSGTLSFALCLGFGGDATAINLQLSIIDAGGVPSNEVQLTLDATPPAISDLRVEDVTLNNCQVAGRTGTRFQWALDYTDDEGQVVEPALISAAFQFVPSGGTGQIVEPAPTLVGDGFSGTALFGGCFFFGSDERFVLGVFLIDAGSSHSNFLTLQVEKPDGANKAEEGTPAVAGAVSTQHAPAILQAFPPGMAPAEATGTVSSAALITQAASLSIHAYPLRLRPPLPRFVQ